ncbi:hypothetical protein MtrunA17_Chr3g0120371 [Medicago truncatula]|uniref:Uncharacterized protein n=1 Tax=Medicago truncatula TaxID=3880 RepID=A0A396IU04_MEDTR|nr:hypothetical protein MtrunA17_Chr3g0120371 [Medicago truncatula]
MKTTNNNITFFRKQNLYSIPIKYISQKLNPSIIFLLLPGSIVQLNNNNTDILTLLVPDFSLSP